MIFPTVPPLPSPVLHSFLVGMVKVLLRELAKRTPDDTVRNSVFLRSPDGSTWEITVDNAGLIVTTKVSG